MSDGAARANLLDVYAKHPLREETILARIAAQRGTLDDITELDLAHDTLTEITDQNHVGGLAAVVQLAVRAGVGATSRVLDIGSGLGGSTRALAYLFGCRADGVELSPQRHADAVRLTDRVGLAHLVTCTCGDILELDLPHRHYDVVWGQGAWMHIADTDALLERAARALAIGGRVAFDEACLGAAPGDAADARLRQELERLWGGRFLSRDAWRSALTAAGLEVVAIDDLTPAFVAHFERLAVIAQADGGRTYPAHETDAFGHALALTGAGSIAYSRFVARLPADPDRQRRTAGVR